jgi:hypothetical protein
VSRIFLFRIIPWVLFLLGCIVIVNAAQIVSERLPVINCQTARGKAGVTVRGYDGKRYRVDVCAVAESADGEEFRFPQ